MLPTLQFENLPITRPSAPVPVSALGSGIAKRATMSFCSQKFPKRCGIGHRYGCVDTEEPCGSRDSVLVHAAGPRSGRLDASTASDSGVACPSPPGQPWLCYL